MQTELQAIESEITAAFTEREIDASADGAGGPTSGASQQQLDPTTPNQDGEYEVPEVTALRGRDVLLASRLLFPVPDESWFEIALAASVRYRGSHHACICTHSSPSAIQRLTPCTHMHALPSYVYAQSTDGSVLCMSCPHAQVPAGAYCCMGICTACTCTCTACLAHMPRCPPARTPSS